MPVSEILLVERTGNIDNEREQVNKALQAVKDCLFDLQDSLDSIPPPLTATEGVAPWGSIFGVLEDQQDLLDALNLKTDEVDFQAHVTDTTNPHSVSKVQVGLGSVPNLDTTDAVNKAHDQNTDTELDFGGANNITASTLRTHVDDATKHRLINDAGVATTDLWSADKISGGLSAAFQVVNNLDEIPTQADRLEAQQNLGLHIIDGGTFT